MDNDTVHAINIELQSTGTDAGICVEAQCPDCHETITVAEKQWWESKCECGRVWNMDIDVYAERET